MSFKAHSSLSPNDAKMLENRTVPKNKKLLSKREEFYFSSLSPNRAKMHENRTVPKRPEGPALDGVN